MGITVILLTCSYNSKVRSRQLAPGPGGQGTRLELLLITQAPLSEENIMGQSPELEIPNSTIYILEKKTT